MKFLIIDELSVVSSDLWADIDSRLTEIFMMIPEKAFAGLSVPDIDSWVQRRLKLGFSWVLKPI